MGITWNPEISFGTIVTVIPIIIVGIGAFIKLGKFENKLDLVYSWFDENIVRGAQKNVIQASLDSIKESQDIVQEDLLKRNTELDKKLDIHIAVTASELKTVANTLKRMENIITKQ
jgi:hypothetical protein